MDIDRLVRVKIRNESETEMEEKIIRAVRDDCSAVKMVKTFGNPTVTENSSVQLYFKNGNIIDLCVCTYLGIEPTVEELLELFKQAEDGQALRDMIREKYIIAKE